MAKINESSRPGIMLYFDDLEPSMDLSDEKLGKLLRSIFEYCRYDTIPDLSNDLKMAWGFIRPKLDKDNENYFKKIRGSKYANFCKQCKRLGVPFPEREEWDTMNEEAQTNWLAKTTGRNQTEPGGTEQHPTTTTYSTATSKSNSTPTSIPTSDRTAVGDGGGAGEEEPVPPYADGKNGNAIGGWSPLSDSEFETARSKRLELLDTLPNRRQL